MSFLSHYFSSTSAPILLPHAAIGLYLYSHAFLSTRFKKTAWGIDHNVCPRQDLDKYGQAAVAKGKITQAQLDELYRQEGAHQNSMVQLPYFLAAVVFAKQAGLANAAINKICLFYAVVRILYGYSYVNITKAGPSYLRSLLWWTSNFTCFYALWQGGKLLNGPL